MAASPASGTPRSTGSAAARAPAPATTALRVVFAGSSLRRADRRKPGIAPCASCRPDPDQFSVDGCIAWRRAVRRGTRVTLLRCGNQGEETPDEDCASFPRGSRFIPSRSVIRTAPNPIHL
jgi:hypothetical protein